VSVLVCTERSERERESGRSDGRCSTSTTKVQDRCIVSRGPGCCCCCWLLSFSHSISVGVTLLHLFDRQSLNSRGVLTRSWYSARRWETMILLGTWRRCGTVKELRHADTTPICGLSSATSRSALCYDFMRVTYGLFFNAWPYTFVRSCWEICWHWCDWVLSVVPCCLYGHSICCLRRYVIS